ncbi:MAG: caspase family protein [Pyrinomonadaceae bacterium]
MFQRRRATILSLCLFLLVQIFSTPPPSQAAARSSSRARAVVVATHAKYAMLVGVNKYPGNPLNGCVNDVTSLREMLINNFGFAAENIVMLTDEQATRANILSNLDGFGAKLHRDDLFVFAYSGHGTLFPDSYSEEQDETDSLHFEPDPRNDNKPFFEDGKYDAAICPVDSRETSSGKPWHNLILDDELYARFSRFASQGAYINYLTDSCFSGTQGRDLFKTRSMKLSDALGVPVNQIRKPASQHRADARGLGGRYLIISSSNSLQPSSEWKNDKGEPCGLFSYVFQKLVKLQNGKITYKELYENSEYVIKKLSKDNQDPQIDTRYYNGSLDQQIFTIPTAQEAAPSNVSATTAPAASAPVATVAPASDRPLRVLMIVMDPLGKLLDKCSFAIFKPGVIPVKGQIKREDILLLGRTNENGYFDSEEKNTSIKAGTYPVKIVREGYKSFISTMEVRQGEKEGYAILAVRLNAE